MMYSCPHCGVDVEFEEDGFDEAAGECENCGPVSVVPSEILWSIEQERQMDAARDERLDP